MTLAELLRNRAISEHPHDVPAQRDWLASLCAALYRGFSPGMARISDQTGPSAEEIEKRKVGSVLLTTEEINRNTAEG